MYGRYLKEEETMTYLTNKELNNLYGPDGIAVRLYALMSKRAGRQLYPPHEAKTLAQLCGPHGRRMP